MKVSVIPFGLAVIGLILVGGCDGTQSPGWSTDVHDAQDPSGKTPLAAMPTADIEKALEATTAEIQLGRPMGMALFLDELRKDLTTKGLDGAVLDGIDDTTVTPAAKPMPGGTVANKYSSDTSKTEAGLGSRGFALSQNEYTQHYDCPVLAPEDNEGTECDGLIKLTLERVKQQIEDGAGPLTESIEQNHSDLDPLSTHFVAAWVLEAQTHGAAVAATYAKYELRAAGQCDSKVNAHKVSIALGQEQGWQIVESFRTWALQQVRACVVNTDQIAEQVRKMSRNAINSYMEENVICERADLPTNNPKVLTAEVKRREGIEQGIEERVEVLRNELFQTRQQTCNRGGGGDPLVIDLDDDGLTLSGEQVEFDLLADGTQQKTTWVGAREGIVAIDLDGDGAISSSAELMSNESACDDGKCYDGVRALSAYDSAERGGNADGVISAKDQVFSRLLIWVDENHDGQSQAGELSSFADHGILAIDLKADETVRDTQTAAITAKMQVLTSHGFRDAYDVWFRLQLRKQNLAALLPSPRR